MSKSETGNLLARVAGYARSLGLTASSLVLVVMMSASSANAAEKTWQQCLSCGTNELLQHKISDAESSFRQAVASVEQVSHKPDERAECLYQLAYALTLEGKTDESIKYYCRSLHVLEEAYGDRSPRLVTTLYRLGSAYKEKGNHALAKKLYALAMEISRPHAGPCSPAVASGLKDIGKSQIYIDDAIAMGRYEPTSESLKEQASLNASHRMLVGFSQPEQDLQTDKENSDNSFARRFSKTNVSEKNTQSVKFEDLSTSPSAESLEPQQKL